MSRARHKKASGGKVSKGYSDSEKTLNAGGNPNVIEEARERKHGGRANMKAEGDKPKKRLDRFRRGGRALGERIGADKAPLSSASRVRHVGSTAGSRD